MAYVYLFFKRGVESVKDAVPLVLSHTWGKEHGQASAKSCDLAHQASQQGNGCDGSQSVMGGLGKLWG